MNRRYFAAAFPLALPAAAQPPARPRLTEFPAPAFGATGDGRTLDTAALQKAIDACSAAGGGAVLIPPGVYHTSTLEIRSGVTLRFAPGAKLLGSSNLADYPSRIPALRSYTDNYTEKSLIYAEKASDIGMEGPGVIDHQGASFKGPYKVRPYTMRFIECRNVSVRDIRLEDSPMWVQHYLACEGVYLTNVTVRSRVNANNDGIDIDACSRVRISDCDIWSGDDAIVLKSTCATPCRDIAITNCVLSSACNAIKLGTESNGGFLNIAISNCSIYDTRLSGLALEMVDGGVLDGVTVAGLQMRNVHCPIFVRLGNRARPFQEGQAKPGQGALRNIVIQSVQATGAGKTGCSLTGLAEAPIENLMLRDIALTFVGGGTAQDAARAIPEVPDKYPEHSMFGILSAYGFYVRHARGVTMDNVRLRTAAEDFRPPFVAEDVERFRLTGFDAQSHAQAAAALRLIDVRQALLQGNHPPAGAPVFARAEGARTAAIHFAANALASGMRENETAAGAAPGALSR